MVRLKFTPYVRNWICFHFMGNINNFSYCVVNAAGQSLAAYFDNSKNIALVLWANIAFGFAARLLNTFALEKVGSKLKIAINCFIMGGGLVGVALSYYVNFAFCISMIALIGIASSFGESVVLSYLKLFPSDIVNGWSSGTGVAGVSGSLFYIGLVAAGLSNSVIFYCILPTVLVYFALFFFGLKVPTGTNEANPYTPLKSETEDIVNQKKQEKETLIENADGIDQIVEPMRGPSGETKRNRYIRCAKLVWWNAINLMLVYFFEYVASVGGADLAVNKKNSNDWFVTNSYAILSFCYQFGVLISRSSLQLFKIHRIGILTVLQGINMVLWIVQAYYRMIESVWVLFALMIYCGLLGGASYVNVFYLILHDKKIPDEDREVCINYAALLVTVGITLASCFILIMDHTFLAFQVAANQAK
ncbi:Batten's disease protein Cln3 family protein [Cavenderia fasciculata]|uniref:Battenin n=1 Tax=Cavenderia fasciculata TaxID=261658 RepID=F4PSH1_CACFS|nr:Batten's disease protein Cln3 family protein [Cavenderia fasciculata]EGG21501.1 Batten's disease protein Cln3 family protein [Cavenderia fasciculata]|eukprot:XP_004359351.1 Batten's disease protein Cln3 family protein [Cavenderia fasciculata]